MLYILFIIEALVKVEGGVDEDQPLGYYYIILYYIILYYIILCYIITHTHTHTPYAARQRGRKEAGSLRISHIHQTIYIYMI